MATFSNAIKKNLNIYYGKNGVMIDKSGDLIAYANDDETFVINAFIEDGVTSNATTLINFTPNDKVGYTSHWFTMFYRELGRLCYNRRKRTKKFCEVFNNNSVNSAFVKER